MKKIIILGTVMLLVMALAAGGTWAFFSDVETSTGNTLMAGTLNLGLGNTPGVTSNTSTSQTWKVTSDNWSPGGIQAGTLYLKNNGSIRMNTLSVNFTYSSVDFSGRPADISGSPWTTNPTDYFDKMIVATDATWRGADQTDIKGLTLAALKALGNITLSGGLNNGEEQGLAITWTFLDTATNGCQGNSVDVTVNVSGTQN